MKALAALRIVERVTVVTIFLVMIALYFINVLSRQVGGTFATNFAWVEETVRLLSLFLVFLALGLALERGRHVGVYSWRDRIATRLHLPLRKIIDVIALVFSLYLAWLGYKMTAFVYSTGQISPTLNMQIFWIYLAPTIGFLLLGLRYGLSLFGVIDRFAGQDGGEH